MGKKKKGKEQEPQYYMSQLNNPMLNYRVYVFGAREKVLFSLLTFGIGGAVGLIFYGGLFKANGETTLATVISNCVVFCLIGGIASKIFIPTIREKLRKKRITRLKTQFRDFLTTLSTAMSGGMNVQDSLISAYRDMEVQYSKDAYMVKEIAEMLSGIQNNIALENMLADFGYRSGVDDISNFATVFSTCYRTGGNLKEVLRRTTSIISDKMVIAEEIETTLTSNKMQMMIMNVIPIFLVLMMKSMSSEFSEAFASVVGVIATSVSVAIFIAAYVLGQKIMDIKG